MEPEFSASDIVSFLENKNIVADKDGIRCLVCNHGISKLKSVARHAKNHRLKRKNTEGAGKSTETSRENPYIYGRPGIWKAAIAFMGKPPANPPPVLDGMQERIYHLEHTVGLLEARTVSLEAAMKETRNTKSKKIKDCSNTRNLSGFLIFKKDNPTTTTGSDTTGPSTAAETDGDATAGGITPDITAVSSAHTEYNPSEEDERRETY
ncbi:MAG: uncharacterized protein A8A55_1974 [Amphiamblys sp. WSBS2006]|nr:MAG: uncharacterized protein A8A55_1974 [Amphiamblys sp. WSBS2006]